MWEGALLPDDFFVLLEMLFRREPIHPLCGKRENRGPDGCTNPPLSRNKDKERERDGGLRREGVEGYERRVRWFGAPLARETRISRSFLREHIITTTTTTTRTTILNIRLLLISILSMSTTMSRSKEMAIAALDAELSSRVKALREQYTHLIKSLRARGEVRILKLPRSARETRMTVLLEEHRTAHAAEKDGNGKSAELTRNKAREPERTEAVTQSPSKLPSASITTIGTKRKAVLASPSKSPVKPVKRGRTQASDIKKPTTTVAKRSRRGGD